MDDVHFKPRIPDGEYIVEFSRYYTAEMFRERTPKVCLVFSIVEGDYAGFQLERYYSADRLIGPPSQDGNFKAKSQTCLLLMEYCTCFPDQGITRLDRIPMSRWKEERFLVRTCSTKSNHRGREIPMQLRSSKIEEIIKRIE